MATFQFEQMQGVPDRAWVDVDGIYSVTIIRTGEGIIIDVWPVGADEPFATLGVCDNDIREEDDDQ